MEPLALVLCCVVVLRPLCPSPAASEAVLMQVFSSNPAVTVAGLNYMIPQTSFLPDPKQNVNFCLFVCRYMKYEENGYKSASSINEKNVVKNFQCLGLRQDEK